MKDEPSELSCTSKFLLFDRKESDLILEGGIIRACGLGSVNIALTMATFIVFSVYTATGGELSPRRVFITLSLLINLRLISVQWSVHNVLNMFEGWVALVRLQVGTLFLRERAARGELWLVLGVIFGACNTK